MCEMLGDPKRAVYAIGRRFSDPIGQLFSRHLRLIRADVFHIPTDSEAWPDCILRMRARDVLVTIEFRRYEEALIRFAGRASPRPWRRAWRN